jgi:hypothetical protein
MISKGIKKSFKSKPGQVFLIEVERLGLILWMTAEETGESKGQVFHDHYWLPHHEAEVQLIRSCLGTCPRT